MSHLYDDYDAFAARYGEATCDNAFNAHGERPAFRAMVGEVKGLDVLDIGCAAGDHAAWFLAGGARVVALDANVIMVELARRRLGDDATVVLHDIVEALPFDDASFDLVGASLVLHYVEHWEPVLREIRRVLHHHGRLIVSTHHPDSPMVDVAERSVLTLVEDRWKGFAEEAVRVRYWHRSAEAIASAFTRSGWTIVRSEPIPVEGCSGPPFLLLEARPSD